MLALFFAYYNFCRIHKTLRCTPAMEAGITKKSVAVERFVKPKGDTILMHKGEFGSCCKDLRDAMTMPPVSLFRVEENGVLFLTIGYAQTPEGTGWFDQALIFCPFCGTQIQDREDIRKKSS